MKIHVDRDNSGWLNVCLTIRVHELRFLNKRKSKVSLVLERKLRAVRLRGLDRGPYDRGLHDYTVRLKSACLSRRM